MEPGRADWVGDLGVDNLTVLQVIYPPLACPILHCKMHPCGRSQPTVHHTDALLLAILLF